MATTGTADTNQHLWAVVEPYVAAEGVELDDIELVGSGRVVRVVLDSKDLGVDRIAEVSRGISRLLDEDDPMAGSWTLEVTSPGLERKLRRPRHYEKALGREIKLKVHSPIDGERSFRGILTAADAAGFEIDVDGELHHIAYDTVASARTVFVWEKNARPGKKA